MLLIFDESKDEMVNRLIVRSDITVEQAQRVDCLSLLTNIPWNFGG
jgi:hypothetical protein